MRLVLVVVFLVCALGCVALASANAIPPPTTEVTVEVHATELEPGESLEITVTIENPGYYGDQAVDLLATVDETTIENTTVNVPAETTETVHLSEPMPEEGAHEVTVTTTADFTTETDETLVVVGEPEVEHIEFDVASTVFPVDEWFIFTAEVSFADGPTAPIDTASASITVDGETPREAARYPDPEDAPVAARSTIGYHATGDPTEVTLAASYLGETATLDVLFTDEVALVLEDDFLEVGERTTVTPVATHPAGHTVPFADEHGLWSADGTEVVPEEPGEMILVLEHYGLEAEERLEVVSPTEEIDVSVPDSIAVGDTVPVVVEATDRDGETREVTHSAAVEIENASVLGVDAGQLVGLAPGETTITAEYEWQTATTTVSVSEHGDGLPGPSLPLVALAVALGVLTVRRWA